jgi:hypothetical protein
MTLTTPICEMPGLRQREAQSNPQHQKMQKRLSGNQIFGGKDK